MIGNTVPLFPINSCFMYIAFPVCRNNSLHIGRFNDLSAAKLIFRSLIRRITAKSEDVRYISMERLSERQCVASSES